ncbi:hypothetical protein [Streptomyces sp. NPDC002088]|uniref:hypothetical protein n=1 Tax=Streptomyces sp. NPDC002088 TaxID=3154665 RepID=UPI00331C0DD9
MIQQRDRGVGVHPARDYAPHSSRQPHLWNTCAAGWARDPYTRSCPTQPVRDATADRTSCTRDGDAWYRSAGEQSEYAVPKKGYVVRVGGDGVPRDVLRAAAHKVHRPSADELDALLPSAAPAATEPVERGDLPTVGDGAPNNNPGAGG